jgi:hypothetical protein
MFVADEVPPPEPGTLKGLAFFGRHAMPPAAELGREVEPRLCRIEMFDCKWSPVPFLGEAMKPTARIATIRSHPFAS